MQLEALLNGGFQPKRYRPAGISNWSGHLPFAADLVAAVKPDLLLELGTHYGECYFGFCQAIRENGIACSCYAVSAWGVAREPASYDESVYRDVQAYNTAHYSDFSYLLKSTYDEALTKFSDDSVDILHIHRPSTYQAIARDFRSWVTKVKPGGILLIDQVMIRDSDCGVWKLWEELAGASKHFTFRHSGGLGVFRKPGSVVRDSTFFALLFDSPELTADHVRKFYSLCAVKLEHERENANLREPQDPEIAARFYHFGNSGYVEEASIRLNFKAGEWQHISVDLINGLGNGPLRMDPAEEPSLIDVSGIVLRRPADGEAVWSAKGSEELASLSTSGTLIRLTQPEERAFCRFFSYGSDPQLFLPALDSRRFDQPLVLEVWLRVQNDMASLLPALQIADQQRSRIEVLESALHETRSAAATKHQTVSYELDTLRQERDNLAAERETLLNNVRRMQSELYVCKTDLRQTSADLKQTSTEETGLRIEIENLRQRLAASERTLNEAFTSRSWRITTPIRKLSKALGAQR